MPEIQDEDEQRARRRGWLLLRGVITLETAWSLYFALLSKAPLLRYGGSLIPLGARKPLLLVSSLALLIWAWKADTSRPLFWEAPPPPHSEDIQTLFGKGAMMSDEGEPVPARIGALPVMSSGCL